MTPHRVRPRLLDLFCGAGGAAMGYSRAGFEVVGVDINPQPNYPFEFHQADALTWPLDGFDAIHASPPCQAHSTLAHAARLVVSDEEFYKFSTNLIPATRDLLCEAGLPHVIENVPGAPLIGPVILCGSMFGLGASGRQLRRHRLFECSWPMLQMLCQHNGEPVGVYGTGGGGQMTRGYKGTTEEYREAMGMPWASRREIAQAIPPAYTEFLGTALLDEVLRVGAVVA